MSKCKPAIFILLTLSAVFASAASAEAKEEEGSASERAKRVCEFRDTNRSCRGKEMFHEKSPLTHIDLSVSVSPFQIIR